MYDLNSYYDRKGKNWLPGFGQLAPFFSENDIRLRHFVRSLICCQLTIALCGNVLGGAPELTDTPPKTYFNRFARVANMVASEAKDDA